MSGRNIKLQDLRTEKNWTLRTAAQHIGVTKTVLFNAEQGVMPRVDHAIQIAGQYDRSVEDLWAPVPRVESLRSPPDQHDSPRKPAAKTSICPRPDSKPGGLAYSSRPRSH
jgi:DNA-binding XRE family transcriptional regulator